MELSCIPAMMRLYCNNSTAGCVYFYAKRDGLVSVVKHGGRGELVCCVMSDHWSFLGFLFSSRVVSGAATVL